MSGVPPKKRRLMKELERNDCSEEDLSENEDSYTCAEDINISNESSEAGKETHDYDIENENHDNIGTKPMIRNNSETQIKRNAGMKYTSKSGKIISERRSRELSLYCRLQCYEKVCDEDRLILFKQYWDLGKYSTRVCYISNRIEHYLKKSTRKPYSMESLRNNVFKYRIYLGDNIVYVCKKCFLNVYGETAGFLRSVQERIVKNRDMEDMRGKSLNSRKQVFQSTKNDIIAHINSFPAYKSHYSRSHTNQKYLAQNLTLMKMYELYTEKTEKAASYATYRRIFKTQKLKFKKPSLDTCSKCDQYSISIKYAKSYEVKNQYIQERDNHQRIAETAYASKKFDKTDDKKTVLCMDLQRCLPTPYLNSYIAFYKRSLWTFNFTIRNCSTNKTYCFVWDESVGGRGANEIASCLWKFFNMNIDLRQHVVIYSDTCSGQNKNNIVSAMFVLLINQCGLNVELIEQKCLEPGHTHLECDSDHSIIERKKKRMCWKYFIPMIGFN